MRGYEMHVFLLKARFDRLFLPMRGYEMTDSCL